MTTTTELICAVCGAPLDPADAAPAPDDARLFYHADFSICQAHIDAVWAARHARAVAFLKLPRARWQRWSDLEYDYDSPFPLQEERDE